MELNEKRVVYRTATRYLETYEPEELEDFEIVFDSTFKMLSRQEAESSGPYQAYGRLRFESAFVEVTAIASVTWLVTLLVRTIAAGPRSEDILQRLDDLQEQLAEYTQQSDRVGKLVAILKVMSEDLAQLKESLTEPATSEVPVDGGVPPDLELRVREIRGRSPLSYQLELHRPELEQDRRIFGSISLRGDPSAYFAELFREVQDLPLDQLTAEAVAEEMQDLGSTLYRKLIPDDLGEFIGSSLDGDKAPTLWIRSDEPWIPWELLRLPRQVDPERRFLCEAFAASRWLGQSPPPLRLPLRNLAIVAPREMELERAAAEVDYLLSLDRGGRKAREIMARREPLREALAGGAYDGWHFCGHGLPEDDPDRAAILLENGTRLTPRNLAGDAAGLGRPTPLIFLNSCHSSRTGLSLTGVGGWAEAFLEAGAGAFLGAYWAIDDDKARRFAESFYRSFLGGMPMAEAVRRARLEIRAQGDPTWLAYTVYGHPLAACGRPALEET